LIKRKQGGSEKKLVGFYANAWRRPPEFSRGQGFGHLTAGISICGVVEAKRLPYRFHLQVTPCQEKQEN